MSDADARALLGIDRPEAQKALAQQAVREDWSVRQVEQAARDGGAPRQRRPRPTPVDPALAARAAAAAEKLTGFNACVNPGKLEIRFESETELAELVEVLERAARG